MLKKLEDFFWDQFAYWSIFSQTFMVWADLMGSNYLNASWCNSEEECIADYCDALWEGLNRGWIVMNVPLQIQQSDVGWKDEIKQMFKDGKIPF
jgi:hypothetical protein